MTFKSTLVFLILACQQISCVMAAECTTAIIASVFGTIGSLLVIAAVVALVWYCCKRRHSASFASTSSADTASDPEFSFPGKTKGGEIGLNGSGTPVTFSHHYSEKAPTVAYNTSGVVNPAFGGSHEVLIDMPPGGKDEVKIDMDGDPSIKPPSYNGDVRIDMEGKSDIKTPSGSGDVKLDMDWDPRVDVTAPDAENRPKQNLPSTSVAAVDLPGVDLKPSEGRLPGADANVVINGLSEPELDVTGAEDLEVVDAFLERPGHGGFGLLIARDKTLPPPALFVREVTPGGIAAKTGLIDKGDKIIGINGVAIEGMPHDKAMELLRDDERPLLHLKLFKKALYKEKERSFDLSGGSIEQSYNADIEPVLLANAPSLDVEGLQGDAPDLGSMDISSRKPRVSMSESGVDMTEGKLKTQVTGPDAFSDVDLSDPSADWDLPTTKKKRGNCFSCASSGDKEEPYRKGRANAGLELDRPDMKTGGKVKMSRPGLDGSGPSVNTQETLSGPSVNREGLNFDSSRPGANISSRPNTHLDLNAPDIETPDGKLRTHISGQEVGFSSSKQQSPQGKIYSPSAELDLHSKKNYGIGDSMEMNTGGKFDLSGSASDIQGAERRIKQEDFGLRASVPDVDLDADKGRNIDFSGPNVTLPCSSVASNVSRPSFDGETATRQPNMGIKVNKPKVDLDTNSPDITAPETKPEVDVTTGKIKDPSMKLRGSSAEVNLPPSKKKLGNCLACAGTGEKDGPYRKAKGNAGYSFDATGVDGSMEMKDISGPAIDASGSDVDLSARLPKGEMSSNVPDAIKTGANVRTDISGPDLDVSTGKTPVLKTRVETPSTGVGFSKEVVSTNVPDVDGPEANITADMAGSDFDASTAEPQGPNVGVNKPSAEFGFPSAKKKGGNCFSCVGTSEKDEPYKTTKRKASFDFDGPEGDASPPSGNINAGISGPDFDVRGPKTRISIPDVETDGPQLDVSMPDVDAKGPKPGISKPDLDASGPKPGVSEPKFDVHGPVLDTGVSKPDFDVHEPNTSVSGPDFGGRGPKAGISGPDLDVCGPKTGMSGPNFDVRGPNATISRPDINVRGPNAGVSGPDVDVRSPNAGVSGPDFDARGPRTGIFKPALDVSGPKAAATGPDFDAHGPKADVSTGKQKVGLNTNTVGFDAPQGNISTKMPGSDVKAPTGTRYDPKVTIETPSPELGFPSKKAKGGSCLSCAGSADKDEPYRKTKENTEVALKGPDVEVKGPDVNIEALRGGGGNDFILSASSPDVDNPNLEGEIGFARSTTSFPSTSGGVNLDVGSRVSGQNITTDMPNVDGDTNAPNIQKPRGKLQTEMPSPEHSTGDVRGPSVDGRLPSRKKVRGNCLSCTGDADKDEPYGKPPKITEVDAPDIDGSLEIKKGGKLRFDEPNANIDGQNIEAATSEIDLPSSKVRAKAGRQAGGNGEIELTTPEFSHGKPKVSGPSIGVTDKDFGIRGPDLDTDTPLGEGDWGFTKPDISGTKGKMDLDVNPPDLDVSPTKPGFDWGITKPDISGPKGKMDIDVNPPDLDVSPTKPGFGVKGLGMTAPKPDSHASDLRLGGNLPDLDVSGETKDIGLSIDGLDKNIKGTKGELDLDINRPDFEVSGTTPPLGVKGLDIDTPEPDIPTGDLRLASSMPSLDVSGKKPEIDLSMDEPGKKMTAVKGKLDDDLDLSVVKPPSVEPNGRAPFQSNGKEFNVDIDWGVNTSTPKAPEPHSELHIETEPLDGDIPVVNNYNFQLESTPDKLPSVDYEEPRSLQRYDEIRPDMELRLLSPTETEKPEHSFNFDSNSLEVEQSDKRVKPGRMSLVKVEENVTVCSASLEDVEPVSPRSRTLTLDREIKQTIEVVFPGEDSSGEKRKSSTGSSSPSSDNDADKEKKSKRKKKSRLRKGSRKSSTSSSSSKEGGDSTKHKKKERRSSKSSSSSHNENERKEEREKDPSTGEALRVIHQGDLPNLNESKRSSSPSSADNGEHRDGKEGKEILPPEVQITSSIIIPEPDISLKAVTRDSPSLRPSSEKEKERKSSTSSSSSSGDTGKKSPDKEKSKQKKKSRFLKAFRKSSTSSASSKEDRTATRKKEGERRSSTSSSSSDDEREGKRGRKKVPQQTKAKAGSHSSSSDEAPTAIKQMEFPNRKESKSSTSSSDDEPHKEKTLMTDIPTREVTTISFIRRPEPDVSFEVVTPDSPSLAIESEKAKERKSSSSSSSSDEGIERKTVEYKIVSTEYLVNVEKKEPEKSGPTLPLGKTTGPDLSLEPEQREPKERKSSTSSSSDGEEPKMPQDSKSSQTYIIAPHDDLDRPVLSVADVQEDASVVEFHSGESTDPVLSPQRPNERKSSTNSSSSSDVEKEEAPQRIRSSSSEDSGCIAPKAVVTVYTYEMTHPVLTHEYPEAVVEEHPLIVVSRSFKRPVPDNGDNYEPEDAEMQLSEPPMDVTHHLEYPYKIKTVEEDTDKQAKEEDIVPVFKLKSDFLVELESDDKASEDENETEHSIPGEREHRASPTWDMQPHTFETVYHMSIPENPAKDEDSFQIQEHSPIVVSRSIKRISYEGLDLEDEPSLYTTTKDVQLSEPSYDFQLEYPERGNVFTAGENDLEVADEEWIVTQSLKKDEPDIEALQASLDHTGEKDQPRPDSSRTEDDKPTSPGEKSPRDTARRGSNSRLWELMQGYLIERPVLDDGETEAKSEKAVEAKKEEEPRVETTKLETKVERTVYRVSLQPAKLEPVNVPLQFGDKEPAKEAIASVPRVDSTVSKETSSTTQFDPVKFQVNLGGNKADTGWKKQPSLPAEEDDNENDPWMRHYSKGLHRGQHQPASSRSLERESTSNESSGLSFSKVPHVKGVRTSAEKERPRYAIESRIRTEPIAFQSSTDQSQVRKSREETARPSVSSLRSFWNK